MRTLPLSDLSYLLHIIVTCCVMLLFICYRYTSCIDVANLHSYILEYIIDILHFDLIYLGYRKHVTMVLIYEIIEKLSIRSIQSIDL